MYLQSVVICQNPVVICRAAFVLTLLIYRKLHNCCIAVKRYRTFYVKLYSCLCIVSKGYIVDDVF